jgi:hypothetical protein
MNAQPRPGRLQKSAITGEQPSLRHRHRGVSAFGNVTWTGGRADPVARMTVRMGLTLADDPGYATNLLAAPDSWHQYLAYWVVPRIFIVAMATRRRS